MIVPDVNLLVYAYDSTSPTHAKARAWWERTLSGNEPVGIPWIVALAFVRLMTHPTLNGNPMTVPEARAAVASWLARDNARLLAPSPDTFDQFFDLLESAGTGGNLSTDAMIAALAQQYGGRVHSNDGDFDRFEGIRRNNPLA